MYTVIEFGPPVGPEVSMLVMLVLSLYIGTVYWVYSDAAQRGIDSAALWALAIGVLFLFGFVPGMIGLVVYSWQR